VKERLDAFTDGVIAIAITLLILEIKIPPADGPLVPALLAQWGFFAAYLASFLQVGLYWIAHHIASTYIVAVNGRLLFLNLLFLFAIAFIPFPTAIAAERLESGVDVNLAMGLYGVVMLVVASLGSLELILLRHDRLIDEATFFRDAPEALTRRYWVGPVLYAIAAAVAFVAPFLALLFYAIAPLYYAVANAKWRPARRLPA
jgi:uncharacterized membrane protein